MVEADGSLLDPIDVHTFAIHVAQRYFVHSPNKWHRNGILICVVMNRIASNDQLDPQVRGVLRYTDDVNQPNTTALTKRMAFISQDMNLTELVPLIAQPVPGPALFFAWKSVFKHAPANQITDP